LQVTSRRAAWRISAIEAEVDSTAAFFCRHSTERPFDQLVRQPNVRFMFNYLHGDITKQVSATDVGDVGARSSTRSQCAPTSHSRQNKNDYVCASL
jgi:hypothetical protein